MDDEELNTLRTKLMLLGGGVEHVLSLKTTKQWAVVYLGSGTFLFEPSDLRCFYETEEEALQEGIRLSLLNTPRTPKEFIFRG